MTIFTTKINNNYPKHIINNLEHERDLSSSSTPTPPLSPLLGDELTEKLSGNIQIDKYIKDTQTKNKDRPTRLSIRWIPFNEFENVKKIRQGGEGLIYTADWVNGPSSLYPQKKVILKSHFNSQDGVSKFLDEVTLQVRLYYTNTPLCYGISRDDTNNYLIVMQYAEHGTLHEFLSESFHNIDWEMKLRIVYDVAEALKEIHKAGFVHGDFHDGNILKYKDRFYISDLGLCTRDKSHLNNVMVGVLPYVAPEILNKLPYTTKADIYGFGMIMWQVFTGKRPFGDRKHDCCLANEIMEGKRPKLPKESTGYILTSSPSLSPPPSPSSTSNINNNDNLLPEKIVEYIKKCWDPLPGNRPDIITLLDVFRELLIINKGYKSWQMYQKEENTDYYEDNDVDYYSCYHHGRNLTVDYHHILDISNTSQYDSILDV